MDVRGSYLLFYRRPRYFSSKKQDHQKRKLPSKADFAFALGNMDCSDVMIRVFTTSRASSTAAEPCDQDPEFFEIPASRLVMAANSPVFKKMIRENLKKSQDKRSLELHIDPSGEHSFLELLKFMYSGKLGAHISSSFTHLKDLLLLSHKFNAQGCFEACSQALSDIFSDLKPEDAIALLSLPLTVREHPLVSPLERKSRMCIVQTYGPLVSTPSDRRLLNLPEPAFLALLDSDELAAESEDVILAAAHKWVCHNSAPESTLSRFCELMLPRLRMCALSPVNLVRIFQLLGCRLKRSWELTQSTPPVPQPAAASRAEERARTSHSPQTPDRQNLSGSPDLKPAVQTLREHDSKSDRADSAHSYSNSSSSSKRRRRDEASPPSQEASHPSSDSPRKRPRDADVAPNSGTVCSDSVRGNKEALDAMMCTLTYLSEQRLIDSGTVPSGKLLGSRLSGTPSRGPRLSHRNPDGRVFVDVPVRRGQDWGFGYLVNPTTFFVNGRWLVLHLKLDDQTGDCCMALTWDPNFDENPDSSFELEVEACVQTSRSKPAYESLTLRRSQHFSRQSSSMSWVDLFGTPWARVLGNSDLYSPEGALRLRVDVWLPICERKQSANIRFG